MSPSRNQEVKQDKERSHLFKLPSELLDDVLGYLDGDRASILAARETCRNFYDCQYWSAFGTIIGQMTQFDIRSAESMKHLGKISQTKALARHVKTLHFVCGYEGAADPQSTPPHGLFPLSSPPVFPTATWTWTKTRTRHWYYRDDNDRYAAAMSFCQQESNLHEASAQALTEFLTSTLKGFPNLRELSYKLAQPTSTKERSDFRGPSSGFLPPANPFKLLSLVKNNSSKRSPRQK
ncbi:hypothetical protein BU23DRAFT_566362 [Bimuria novae-zelandiae CBS 107.79]|uniref:F-box domain-containing protein n=1 Tax=Bimuria novae-zelandiae CBS 107.79 TaxID=1447943 RepID=A0A6A5VGZ3_9PLEO|nr:hypothetical protein BU23DRAFT_566362 [Bimuria novae-zelandiae CBS 107.79]